MLSLLILQRATSPCVDCSPNFHGSLYDIRWSVHDPDFDPEQHILGTRKHFSYIKSCCIYNCPSEQITAADLEQEEDNIASNGPHLPSHDFLQHDCAEIRLDARLILQHYNRL